MSEPPRMRRLQIHLSTALVMMFVAGGMIWANMSPYEHTIPILMDSGRIWDYPCYGYGFPVCYYNNRVPQLKLYAYDPSVEALHGPRMPTDIASWKLTVDIATALLLLAGVWLLCEWVIRRRAARKGA